MNDRNIPRIALTWLLVAQVLVILPHLGHLPWWTSLLWLVCGGWRIQIYRMRASYPSSLAKAGMLGVMVVGIYLSRQTLIGLDAWVVLLVSAFVLKLVELKARRDALVLVFLGFFVVLTSYLFDDSLPAALYSLLPVTVLLAALIGLQQGRLSERALPTLKLAGSMLLQAIPLMLVTFLLFPRIGPLWSLPMPGGRGSTGLSERMTPADISELTRSSELAFRATFDGTPPPRRQLYWRALTLEQFDGNSWEQRADPPGTPAPDWQPQGPALSYSIIMEATSRHWLYALDTARTDLPGSRQGSDFRLEMQQPQTQRLLYRATSWPQAVRNPQYIQRLWQDLQLPQTGNPQARRWAAELKRRHGADAQAVTAEIMRRFADEPYRYTLRPSITKTDSIDSFLFAQRAGFCAHYAGAMTFVLRAAGIPARVVVGYQGGELNPEGNYLLVRQYDAHAWVEYWQPGKGWLALDPTFQVAPERIELGLEAALTAEDSAEVGQEGSLLSQQQLRDLPWLNDARLAWDSLNYSWQTRVLSYQGDAQQKLLSGLLGQMDATRLGLLLASATAALLGVLALGLLKPWKRERDPLLRLFRRFEQRLLQYGVRRAQGEGPQDFTQRAARELPQAAAAIQSFGSAFQQQRYAAGKADHRLVAAALRDLQRQLPVRWQRLLVNR